MGVIKLNNTDMKIGNCRVCNWDKQWLDDSSKCISCHIDDEERQN